MYGKVGEGFPRPTAQTDPNETCPAAREQTIWGIRSERHQGGACARRHERLMSGTGPVAQAAPPS